MIKQKMFWLYYEVKGFLHQAANAVFRKCKLPFRFKMKLSNRTILPLDEANQKIQELILSGKPTMIARFGGTEGRCIMEGFGVRYGFKKKFSSRIDHQMHVLSGMFPKGQEMLTRFTAISDWSAKQVDMLGWWTAPRQDYLVKHVCNKDILLTTLEDLEPYYSKTPWTAALKGKKVLVIHPFKDTIEAQYKKRELLFEDPNVLPEFELSVLRAVQTIAGGTDDRFANWEEALNYMHDEAMKIDFDVAIIGCGAYGMPLAAKLKASGKTAVHLGGATQLLFGIKGARWDNYRVSAFYNEHWVRPSADEKPQGAKKVEGACYW